jgi:hypothetical protein
MAPLCNSGMSLSCSNERTALSGHWSNVSTLLRSNLISAEIDLSAYVH